MADQEELIKHSVTKGDFTTNAGRSGMVFQFIVNPGYSNAPALPPNPPAYWSFSRDYILKSTIHHESAWAGAISKSITKMAAQTFNIRGLNLRARKARSMLLQADGYRGWVNFLSRHLRDYLLTDNGSFIEIVRESSSWKSKIIGVMHLDSQRCQRTGDPDVPIIYRDRQGRLHEMKDHQVICFSDMEDPGDMYYGVGLCAAARAYKAIYKMYIIEDYITEKVSGRKPLAIHFVNNASWAQIDDATKMAEAEQNARGYVRYMGAIVVPTIDPTSAPQVATIELAGLPERYDIEVERLDSKLKYANAIGVDPQDVDPKLLATKAGGTGSQSRVIDDKASAVGLAAWRQNFIHMLNENILPEGVTFYFQETDWRDQLQKGQVEAQRTTTTVERINAGIIGPEQGNQLLVDAGDLPPEMLMVSDMTPSGEFASDIKPPSPEEEKYAIERAQMMAEQQAQEEQMQMEQEMAMAQAQRPVQKPGQAPAPKPAGKPYKPAPGTEQGSMPRNKYPARQVQTKEVYEKYNLNGLLDEMDAAIKELG